jgi:hypothetical protein
MRKELINAVKEIDTLSRVELEKRIAARGVEDNLEMKEAYILAYIAIADFLEEEGKPELAKEPREIAEYLESI